MDARDKKDTKLKTRKQKKGEQEESDRIFNP